MRITQHNWFLQHAIKLVLAGELVPAVFQRPYAWSKQDVLALFESILRGYPIGSFLLWTPRDKQAFGTLARTRLGPIVYSEEPDWSYVLLDGQNRLASLAWLLAGQDAPYPSDITGLEADTWQKDETLVVDLIERKLCFVPIGEQYGGLRVPASFIFDSVRMGKCIRSRWSFDWSVFSEEVRDNAVEWLEKGVIDQFRNAQVTVTHLEKASAVEAKDAFLHICKVGLPMSEAAFDAAIAWTPPST